jgi:hypothetical protein
MVGAMPLWRRKGCYARPSLRTMTAASMPSRTAAQRLAVLVLLVAFVLAQALGWIHRGLHGDSGPSRGDGTVHELSEPRDGEPGFLERLFGTHADASECRLFDAAAQPAMASAKLVILPLALPTALLLAGHAGFLARWCALFDARGPPPSR